MRRTSPAALLAFLVFFGIVALLDGPTKTSAQTSGTPQPVVETSNQVSSVLYRSALAGTDPVDLGASTIPLYKIPAGVSTVRVCAVFSSPGATATVKFARGNAQGAWIPDRDVSTGSFVADSTYTIGGLYVSSGIPFDVAGAFGVRISISAISAGTISLYLKPY